MSPERQLTEVFEIAEAGQPKFSAPERLREPKVSGVAKAHLKRPSKTPEPLKLRKQFAWWNAMRGRSRTRRHFWSASQLRREKRHVAFEEAASAQQSHSKGEIEGSQNGVFLRMKEMRRLDERFPLRPLRNKKTHRLAVLFRIADKIYKVLFTQVRNRALLTL